MKKFLYIVAALSAVGIAAALLFTGKRPRIGADPVEQARGPVVQLLKDPGSAQFRNERIQADGTTVCGEFNAKNSLGGYVGFRRYVSNSKHFLVEKSGFGTWPLEAVPAQPPDGFAEAISKAATSAELMQMIELDVWRWYWESLCKQWQGS